MSNSSRNLPPITTLQHSSIASHQTEAALPSQIKDEDQKHEEQVSHGQTQAQLTATFRRTQSEEEDQDRNPVHPNAKTTSTINAANGSTTTKTNISSPVCRNCKTQTTPLWRRDESGQVLCNACGLFLKLHGRPRPISLKTDVIKSRNRVRHAPGGSSKSMSNPNTPELKAKDSNGQQQQQQAQAAAQQQQKQKFSPKQYKPSKSNKNSPALTAVGDSGHSLQSPSLVPLLPRGEQSASSGNQYQYNSWSTHLHPQQPQRQTQQQSYLKQHQHFAQPLHYPSSAPTQFAPNLTTITSPLLLATTTSTPKFNPSQSSERASLGYKQKDKELAAVALENLSNDHDDRRIAAVKLEDGVHLNGNKPYSPSSALNSNNSPLMGAHAGTKLPALVAAAAANGQPQQQEDLQEAQQQAQQHGSASPSFGPQFSLSHQHTPHQHSNLSNSSSIPPISYDSSSDSKDGSALPPLKPLLSESNSPHNLPSIHSHHPHHHQSLLNPISHYSSVAHSPLQQPHTQQQPSPPSAHSTQSLPPIQRQLAQGSTDESPVVQQQLQQRSSQSSIDAGAANGAHSGGTGNTDDPNALRTRISELELVNDLYRTRIMELEAMESAARQRETLLKNRLEELKMLPNAPSLNSSPKLPKEEPERKKFKHDY